MKERLTLLITLSILSMWMASATPAKAKDIGPPATWEQIFLPLVMKGGE